MKAQETFTELRQAIAVAAAEYRMRQEKRRRGRDRNRMAERLRRRGAVLGGVAMCGLALCWLVGTTGLRLGDGDRGQRRHEHGLGQSLARHVAHVGAASRITLVALFPRENRIYAGRMSALAASLAGGGRQVQEYWAVAESGYDGEEVPAQHMAAIEAAIRCHQGTETLVVVAAGGFPGGGISAGVKAFIDGGGKLIVVGEFSGESPILAEAMRGQAIVIARRTGWADQGLATGMLRGRALDDQFIAVGG